MFKCAFFNPDHSLAKLHTLQGFTPGECLFSCFGYSNNFCLYQLITIGKYCIPQFFDCRGNNYLP